MTGAAGGIGRALCLELARSGVELALADCDIQGMQAVAQEVAALGPRTICVETDVRNPRSIEALLERTLSELGGCHLLFNNAGLFHGAPLLETTEAQWEQVLQVNLHGVIHGSRIFGAHFLRQGEGHIVNTSSAAGLFPIPGMSGYSTTKSGLVAFSLQLRWELAESNIGVTVLCPGVVKTRIAMRPGVGLEHVDMEEITRKAPGPEGLARKALQAVRKNKPLVRYAPDSYFFTFLRHWPLWIIDPFGRFMGRTAMKTVRKPAELPKDGSASSM